MVIKYIELFTLIVFAVLSDLLIYKIKNLIVLPFIFLGLISNLALNGPNGLLDSILGIIFPFMLLFLLFALRMLGAGDIKLFSAIGSIMGAKFTFYALIYSFLCGGVISFILMLTRKNAKQRMMHLIQYLRFSVFTLSLMQYTQFDEKSDDNKFHFSLAIACGVFFTLFCSK